MKFTQYLGGETEVIMDIHVVIVHNNLILIFSLLLSLRAHALKISLRKYFGCKAHKLENLKLELF